MTWGYAFTPSSWPSILTALLLVVLCAYSVRRRSVPGALPFAVGCVFAALWAAGSAPELAAVDPATKIFWVKFQAVWQLPATTAVTCFILEYTRPGRWLTRRNLVLLSIPSLFVLLSVVTDDLHHLFWRNFRFESEVIPVRGPLNWVGVAFGYGLGLTNLVVLGWLFVRSPEHRWPVVIILSAQIGARVLYAVDAANVVRSAVPLDVISLAYLFAAYAVALFGFGIFDPMPLARRTVMQQMRDGVLVLDSQGRVESLNPAAQRILGVPVRGARGRPLRELLSEHVELGGNSRTEGAEQTEIRLGSGPQAPVYALAIAPLKDWRGQAVGRLILLHDVTEERRAQAQILQQQWAQATLQERELLAHELHDGLAQTLGFLNLQAQAVQVYLRGGHDKAAQDTLDRLSQAALELQSDARELIGNLLAFSQPSESLCTAINQAVTRFEQQNGLPVSLEIADGVDPICSSEALPPAAGVQLLRITQEALANVRKHAGSPSQISVQLRLQAGQVRLTIADNGAGFDPAVTGTDGGCFGLEVMRQRAARIGGQMSVRSVTGQGTRVEVSVPLAAGDEAAVAAAASG